MHKSILDRAASAMASSDIIADVERCRRDDGRNFTTGDAALRALSAQDIARLESQGNSAEDWARVEVVEGFDCSRIRGSTFIGDVVLGRFSASHSLSDGVGLPSGIYDSTIANAKIGHDALVRNVRLLANYWIGPEAVLFDCGRIVCNGPTAFGIGSTLSFGVETGGRDVPIYAEIDVSMAAMIATGHSHPNLGKRYTSLVDEYAQKARSARGIIGSHSVVRHTPIVENTYVGRFGRIDGATRVTESLLFGGETEAAIVESGACVHGSVLQWNARVSTLAIVDRAVLTECSGAERHAKVTSSLLGPNTIVGEGEISSSLVGPFVGFHHQAMLISALWPEGKGNVAAGAQVGSNHTGRAADQEFCPGEGVFIGLGANIKFPADFRRSPYSMVACGVTTAPQAIAFPFSLITPATVPAPAGCNEIIPAWVLTHSLYAVVRNEDKFRRRNRARHSVLASDVFRPEIIDGMRDALARLEAVKERLTVYNEKQISGLGRNILIDKHIGPSIDAYRFFVRYYALQGLLTQIHERETAGHSLSTVRNILIEKGSGRWEHQRRIVCDDFGMCDVREALCELPRMAQQVATSVEQSKAKDEQRGGRVFADYADVHSATADDPIVQQSWKLANAISEQTNDLMTRWNSKPETFVSLENTRQEELTFARQ